MSSYFEEMQKTKKRKYSKIDVKNRKNNIKEEAEYKEKEKRTRIKIERKVKVKNQNI